MGVRIPCSEVKAHVNVYALTAVISVFGKKKLSTKHFLVARDRQPGSSAPRHSFKICCRTFGLLSTSFTVLSLTTGRKVKQLLEKILQTRRISEEYGGKREQAGGKENKQKKKKQSKTSKRTKSRQIWLCVHMANAAWQHCQVPLQNCRELSSDCSW